MSPTANPPRILVVDDDLAVRELLAEYLATRGYEVVAVSDGLEAMRIIEDGEISLVLTDLRIPHPDGLALLQASREMFPHLPFLMITGYGTVESAVYALKLGANDYLLKPFKLRAVLRSIEQALARSRLDAEARSGREALALFEMATTADTPKAHEAFFDRFLEYILEITSGDAAGLYLHGATGWSLYQGAGPGLQDLGHLDMEDLQDALNPAASDPVFRQDLPQPGPTATLTWPILQDPEPGDPAQGILVASWAEAPSTPQVEEFRAAFLRAGHILAVSLRRRNLLL